AAELDRTQGEGPAFQFTRVEGQRLVGAEVERAFEELARVQAAQPPRALVVGVQVVVTDRPAAVRDPFAPFELAWRQRNAAAAPQPAAAPVHAQAAVRRAQARFAHRSAFQQLLRLLLAVQATAFDQADAMARAGEGMGDGDARGTGADDAQIRFVAERGRIFPEVLDQHLLPM